LPFHLIEVVGRDAARFAPGGGEHPFGIGKVFGTLKFKAYNAHCANPESARVKFKARAAERGGGRCASS